MKTFDGLELNVRTYGPEDAEVNVVLAHCWAVSQEDWIYQVRDLQREFGHRIRIVTWDHRGHGQSDPSPREACKIENLARDMADVIATHAATGPIVLAGHSIGGMTIMSLAETYPELFERVTGVALVATSSGDLANITLGLGKSARRAHRGIPAMLALRSRTLSKRARKRAPIIERQIVRRFVFGKPMRLTDAAITVEGIINAPAATMVGFYQDFLTHDRGAALKVLDGIETKVLVGTRDLLTPPSHARLIADAISTAELIVLPDAGHMLPMERDEAVTETIARMVRKQLQ